MKKQLNFILMADVIDSRKAQQNELIEDFKKLVKTVNKQAKKKIVSPLTITLGDEFQGIVGSLSDALQVIIQLEEEIISERADFKLRYVLFEGEIDTPINAKVAYEMLGSGLTAARSFMNASKHSNERFHVRIEDDFRSQIINDAFRVYQSIIDDWQVEKDYEIVNTFLEFRDYKVVADKLNKDRSLMWKREKSAKIKEYLSLKKVISYLGGS